MSCSGLRTSCSETILIPPWQSLLSSPMSLHCFTAWLWETSWCLQEHEALKHACSNTNGSVGALTEVQAEVFSASPSAAPMPRKTFLWLFVRTSCRGLPAQDTINDPFSLPHSVDCPSNLSRARPWQECTCKIPLHHLFFIVTEACMMASTNTAPALQ